MAGAEATLDAYATLCNGIKRKILVSLKAGRVWPGDLKNSLYKDFDVQSSFADGIFRQLDGELKSVSELAKLCVAELEQRIRSKKADIVKKGKSLQKAGKDHARAKDSIVRLRPMKERLETALKANPAKEPTILAGYKRTLDEYHAAHKAMAKLREKQVFLKASLHQHKRRLGILEHRLSEARKQLADPSLCFGSKKLFKAQFSLAENGYASLQEWKADWVSARNRDFQFDGNARATSGNEYAKLIVRGDGYFDLELRLPERLKDMAKRHELNDRVHIVTFKKLGFNHGSDSIRTALENYQPVTIAFRRDGKGWKVHVTVDEAVPHAELDYSCGALGVDLNVGHVAATLADRFGNPAKTWKFPLYLENLSSDQRLDRIRKLAKSIALLAQSLGVPIVSEKLDFSRKKLRLSQERSPRYARMLSSFAYNGFDAALASACARNKVAHRRVNPAYTSLIGRVKFARRYGLSVHAAAALSIARRAMEFSEGIPSRRSQAPAGLAVKVQLGNAGHVTLVLPERKDKPKPPKASSKTRHVWSDWSLLQKAFSVELAAQRSAARKRRRPYPRSNRACGGGPSRPGLLPFRGRSALRQSRPQGYGSTAGKLPADTENGAAVLNRS